MIFFDWKKLKRQRKRNMMRNEKGFTLVEIAIVLVIIGLLIGGVLKGQAMIQNAKTKRIVKSADELRAAVYTFYDKYGNFPGDENSANTPPNDTHNGNGNGQIAAGEADQAFEDLVLAGIIGGDFDGAGEDSIPHHAYGDTYRVLWDDPGGTPTRIDHYIRYDNLPWDVAQEIDSKYDDGVYNTGNIRANEDYTAAANPIDEFYMPL
jgi:prepilin-type N-terminal cleavage/methylation domain-containing protein